MKLTKDEARILASALDDAKYELADRSIPNLYNKLEDLQNRLETAGKDHRRAGRTSMNDFSDCLKRYAKA